MKKKLSIITFTVALMITTVVGATPNGQPFNEIWDEINNIWDAITDLGNTSFVVTERTEAFNCPPLNSCTYTVSCMNDETLTGGGFKANDPGVGVLDVWASNPDIGGNRWRVTTFNPDSALTMEFSIYAMCAQLSN